MGRNCLAELSQAISKIEAELLELKNIKAEVDYKELGIDDGTAAREQDELLAGAVMKATIHPGIDGDTPVIGSLVYLHVTIMNDNDDENEVLFTSRKENGGSGEPCLYILGEGNSRPLRGIEIALMSMTVGERNLVIMKSEMCLMHPEVESSSMANHISQFGDLVDARLTYKADVELVDSKSPHVDSIPCHGKNFVFKSILSEGVGWETPREPFTISAKISSTSLHYRNCPSRDTIISEASITCEIGDKTLPEELELGICSMRKGERAIILVPMMSAHPMMKISDHPLENDQIKPMQIGYMEYEVTLNDLTQARDLMGDGKSIKKIIRKGDGEFPIDCPMEDTTVSIRTRIRKKGDSTWLPFLADSTNDLITFSTGIGELPDIVDAALRVMLKNEVSVLTTEVDEKLGNFFLGELATAFPEGTSIEIEIQLVSFINELPVAALPPEEKLSRAKQMKLEGNNLYKKGKISFAMSKYNKALVCVGKAYEFSEEDAQAAIEIKFSCMLNMAACAQRNSSYGEAIKWCEKVLGEDPENTKAYFRRSKARQSMALFREALEDLERIIEIDPNLKNDVLREKAILIRSAKMASEKQKKEFRNFFTA